MQTKILVCPKKCVFILESFVIERPKGAQIKLILFFLLRNTVKHDIQLKN